MGADQYHAGNLIPMFRKAAAFRNEMLAEGYSDNGGAIHSAERILNVLAAGLKYPYVSHVNSYKRHEKAEHSVGARAAKGRGEKVFIEHVLPHRAFTQEAIKVVDRMTDEQFAEWVKANFRLVLLTAEERTRLDRVNRSNIAADRLESAGIVLALALED